MCNRHYLRARRLGPKATLEQIAGESEADRRIHRVAVRVTTSELGAITRAAKRRKVSMYRMVAHILSEWSRRERH